MKITEIISAKRPSLSFEVFPPKTDDKLDSVMSAAGAIADILPSYMSVTYGAGGTTASFTAEICESLTKRGVTPLAHLTCVNSTKEKIRSQLESLKRKGIENILALRGDIPQGVNCESFEYKYASELIEEIKSFGGFCIGGACYPETHPESRDSRDDIEKVKIKVDAGCDFLTTQMFFDNTVLYNFLYRIREKGITVPVIPGIMPVTNGKQIKRSCELSGAMMPPRFKAIVDKFGDNPKAMQQAGIAYATDQIIDLIANGINNIHVYTMNKPEVAAAIMTNLSEIVK